MRILPPLNSLQPLKLAVIGGGPSAFYVASRILKSLPQDVVPNLRVHVFERLWAPHGLVRYGVAPDHPEVKARREETLLRRGFRSRNQAFLLLNCINKFDQVAEDNRFRFFGNVSIGSSASSPVHALPVPLASVFKFYNHVLFATGCTLPTLHSSLPPSEYCIPALSLVHWYTQHPSAPIKSPPLDKISHVSLIGNGNVSLDVARILLTNVSELSKYDIPESVLEVLARSTVKYVSIIGRRGPLEAAFTMKELREMINLPEASMVPLDPNILKPPASGAPLTRQQSRVLDLLKKGSKNAPGSTSKSWSLDFFRSPIGLVTPPPPPSSTTTASPAQLTLSHTQLDQNSRAVPTGETTTLPTDLVITSLGFHGEPQSQFYDPSLRHLRTLSGRIVSATGKIVPRVYASGWAATGAKGVLATTMMDAYNIAETIVADWSVGHDGVDGMLDEEMAVNGLPWLNSTPDVDRPPQEVIDGMGEGKVFSYDDWRRIDAEERKRGQEFGKERERMSWKDVVEFSNRGILDAC